ncbi:MAG: asparagine synthase-related protein, partial [Planctomycetota bacterium]|nr:asparagine synthase-related protein [Planctomycetota bacterium]
MSGLCGWTGYASGEDDPRVLASMAGALTRHDHSEARTAAWAGGAVAAAALHGHSDLFEREGLRAVTVGRVLIDDERVADPARAVAEAFSERGAAVLDRLSGRFVLAVVAGDEVLLATDRLGRMPLVYSWRDGCLVFGSSGAALQVHPGAASTVDPQSIYEYFFFHQVPAPRTIRKGHKRLLPGSFLHLKNGSLREETYARPKFAPEAADLEEFEREFCELLRESVRECAGDADTACFLSGGTDSSTVAGVLAELSTEKVKSYSIGFQADGYDEMEYATCAAEHFGTEHRKYYVTQDDVLTAVTKIAEVHADPFANESAVPTYFCAKIAKEDGVELMLAGDGGDELFGGNERYVAMDVFARWDRVPAVLRPLVKAGVNLFPFGSKIGLVRKARSYIAKASMPMPDRIYAYALLPT